MLQISRSALQIIGISAILLGATYREPAISVSFIVVGLIIAWRGARVSPLESTNGTETRWAGLASLMLVTGALGRPIATVPSALLVARPTVLALGVVASLVLVAAGQTTIGRRVGTTLAMLVAATLVVILVANEWSSPIGSDVYHAHLEAGAAMADGHSPYSDAVTFADGNPYAPANKMIVGYPYPPVVVAAYGWAGALTDPRLVSTAAWLGFLAWLAWGSWSNRHAEIAGVKASLLAVLALAPLSTEVWFMAWTEPLTLALFLGAALIWYRSQVWSGVVLGLALASKQFLVFLLPLVLLHRDEGWLKRSRAALATAGVTLLVGLIPDAPAFVRSIIGNLTSIGFRPDTQSLPGLVNRLGADFSLPNWLWLLASVVAMIALARSSKTTSGFMLRAGFGLGFAFLIGLAFPNYWFLVAGLLALGAALEPGEIAGITSTGAPVTSQLNRADTSTAGV